MSSFIKNNGIYQEVQKLFVKDSGSYVEAVSAYKKVNGIYEQFFGEQIPAETVFKEIDFLTDRTSEIIVENNYGSGSISKSYDSVNKTLDIAITPPSTSFSLLKFFATFPGVDISDFIYELSFEMNEPENSDIYISEIAFVQRDSGDYATKQETLSQSQRTRDENGIFNIQQFAEDFGDVSDLTNYGRVGLQFYITDAAPSFTFKVHSMKLYKLN